MKRKICIVTGSRAEYGLYKPLMILLQRSRHFQLQIIVTGSHLSEDYGNTYKEILEDGFIIDLKVPVDLKKNKPEDITRATGTVLQGMAGAYKKLQPDLIMLLGDRYEMLAAAVAAHLMQVTVAHIHGGEVTEGSLDDAIRHAITKLAVLHFAAADEYRNRIIQMGEHPSRVFTTGALGVDNCINVKKKSRKALEETFGIKLQQPFAVVTLHPPTNENITASKLVDELLSALQEHDLQYIITYPNADAGSKEIIKALKKFALKNHNVSLYKSLGMENYLSLLQFAEVVIGNSSSGIIEVPCFGIPTVNIGERQQQRLSASSVIHAAAAATHISRAISKAMDKTFRKQCKNVFNPYGNGQAAKAIVNILTETKNFRTIDKKFFNLDKSV